MGLDVNGVLEVTHSFPMPKNQDSEDFEGADPLHFCFIFKDENTRVNQARIRSADSPPLFSN